MTPEQVREVARKYYVDDALTIAHLDPQPLDGQASGGAAAGRAPWRVACIVRWLAALVLAAALRRPAHALLPIQHWQTASGARVYFVENHDLPMLDLSVEFPAGAGYDQAAKSGVASMTNRLLQLGADGMTEDEIARRIADVGAQFGGRFSTDHAGLSLRTLVEREGAARRRSTSSRASCAGRSFRRRCWSARKCG